MGKIKKFISYYGPHKKLFILDMICATIMSLVDLVYPIATRIVINDYIPNNKINLLFKMCAGLAILFIIRFICSYIVESWGHILGVRMEADMRSDIFSHIQTLSVDFFDNNKTGHIMSRIINDLKEITELAHHGPEDLIISIIMLIGSFIILINIEWRLTLIIFIIVIMMGIFGIIKRKKMNAAFKAQRREIANVNSSIENSISGIRVIKSFTEEEYEIEKFKETNAHFSKSREKGYKAMAEFSSGIFIFSNLLDVTVLGLGGYFVYKGYIKVGDLMAYILYIIYLLQPIKKLAQFAQQYQEGASGFERFIEIMNIAPSVEDNEGATKLENVTGKIEFKNVSFKYDDNERKVLSNISFEIQPGEKMALVGPSGGGKSTLCQLLMRFYDIDEGEILLDGENISNIKIRSLRENIGYVHQENFLFSGTVKENILYGDREATMGEVIEAAKNANIHEYIASLPNGYDTNIGEKGIKLSGGQRQRVSIARIFLKNPKILILDEATSALDNENERIIQKSLDKLSEGRTTLIIAHRLSTVENADEIAVLTEAGIVEKGTHKELLTKQGIYEGLYNINTNKI